jgi:hypothetical protein
MDGMGPWTGKRIPETHLEERSPIAGIRKADIKGGRVGICNTIRIDGLSNATVGTLVVS